MQESSCLLQVQNLRTSFYLSEGILRAVEDVSLEMYPGETLSLVGESGCGKTVTALSLMRLIYPPGRIEGGSVIFNGVDLLTLSEEEMRKRRGRDISIIFQEPQTSLNPVFPVGYQIAEVIQEHLDGGKKEVEEQVLEMLRLVGIPSPEKRIRSYPHELSGGMQQRVMIAMALACHPALLIADEPTTALDVTIQDQVLHLITRLKEQLGMSVLLITHDLGVVAEMADKVAVMYAARIVEYTTTEMLFANPLHPYTSGLLKCLPQLRGVEKGRLRAIRGRVPDLIHLPSGCKFHPRCARVSRICRESEPLLREAYPGHWVRCHKVEADDKRYLKGIFRALGKR